MAGGWLDTNLTGGYGTSFGGCLGGTYVYDSMSAAARNATFQESTTHRYELCTCRRIFLCRYFQGWMNGYGRYGIRAAWHDCSEPEARQRT